MGHRNRRFAAPRTLADCTSTGWARHQNAEARFLAKAAPVSERWRCLWKTQV